MELLENRNVLNTSLSNYPDRLQRLDSGPTAPNSPPISRSTLANAPVGKKNSESCFFLRIVAERYAV